MEFRTNKYGNVYPIIDKRIKLPPEEYGHICHEIESNGSEKQKRIGKVNVKMVGNNAYIYKYYVEKAIVFYGKIEISGNEEKLNDIIAFIEGVEKNGIK